MIVSHVFKWNCYFGYFLCGLSFRFGHSEFPLFVKKPLNCLSKAAAFCL